MTPSCGYVPLHMRAHTLTSRRLDFLSTTQCPAHALITVLLNIPDE